MTTPPTPPITPAAFVAKWRRTTLSERAASQEHFIDLCRLLGQPTPAEYDATGAEYTFEKGVTAPGGNGFADVWWKNKFGWEYKRQGKYRTLDEAYAQLQRYREALLNPPLLIVSDIARTEIHINFNNAPPTTYTITLDDIAGGPGIELLRRAFTDPESFRPKETSDNITIAVAKQFASLAERLESHRGPNTAHGDPHVVAHFLMKCTFCLFAEWIGLLPNKVFKRIIDTCHDDPPRFTQRVAELFAAMRTGGEAFLEKIPFFNGGLFDDAPPLPMDHGDLGILRLAATYNWAAIEPSILGTLFERSLDPNKRAQIGAHYTAKEDILLVINPVIIDPLRQEWLRLKSTIESQLTDGTPSVTRAAGGNPRPTPAPTTSALSAQAVRNPPTTAIPARKSKMENGKSKLPQPLTPIHRQLATFLAQLSSLKILDPACGSGNFLYVAIQQLLFLEKEIITFAAQPPISLRLSPRIRPTQLLGIEINRYAAELAQISIWIGFLQWMRNNGYPDTDIPILNKLQTIQNRDAILDFTPAPAVRSSTFRLPAPEGAADAPSGADAPIGRHGTPSVSERAAHEQALGTPRVSERAASPTQNSALRVCELIRF